MPRPHETSQTLLVCSVQPTPAWSVVPLILLVAACTFGSVYTRIEPVRIDVGGYYSLEPQVVWSARPNGNHIVLTIDGESLQAMHLFAGMRDGQPLIPSARPGDRDVPVYRAGMRALDIADLVTASFRLINEGESETQDLRPTQFGALDGFRFDFTYTTRDGLAKRGMVLGAVTAPPDRRLNLIIFTAAAAHYFDASRETINALFQSVKTF